MGPTSYLIFGVALVICLAWVIAHYYSKHRQSEVEEAKYRMLEDDEG